MAVKTNLVQKLTFSFAVFISSAFVHFLPTKVNTLRKSSDEPSGGKGSQPPTPKNLTPRMWIQNKKLVLERSLHTPKYRNPTS